jgi:phage gp29-like protein
MSRGLYLPNGEFREFAAEAAPRRQEMLAEIATREAAGVDLAGWLGVLPDPDPVLRKRGDSAEILTELTGDDQVFMALQDRKSKTLDREWRLTPGAPAGEQPTPAAEQLCKNFARDLEDLDLHALMSELLDAPYFGLTVAELMWAPDGGRMRLTAVTPKPRPWFGFSGDDNHLVFLRLGTWPGEPCSPFKFLAARHFPSFDNPYGSRALSRCLWPVAFKRGGWQFWMNFLEKFGQPWTVATAPDNTDRAKRRDIAADLAAMVQDAVAVLPYGAEVDLKESSGKAGDAHRQLINQCDASIAKVLLGQTLTSDSGDKGSRALGTVHYQVLAGLQNSDARLVRTFFEDLGWIYGRVNAGPDVLTPCWEWSQKIMRLAPIWTASSRGWA